MYMYKLYHLPLSFTSLLFIVFKVYYSRLLQYLSIVEQSLHKTHAAVMVWKCINELRWKRLHESRTKLQSLFER